MDKKSYCRAILTPFSKHLIHVLQKDNHDLDKSVWSRQVIVNILNFAFTAKAPWHITKRPQKFEAYEHSIFFIAQGFLSSVSGRLLWEPGRPTYTGSDNQISLASPSAGRKKFYSGTWTNTILRREQVLKNRCPTWK